jgi:hypothetical protein
MPTDIARRASRWLAAQQAAPLHFAEGIDEATMAPLIAVVRVPPSAWSTSQSMQTVRPGSGETSTAARSDRPTSADLERPCVGARARLARLAVGVDPEASRTRP